MKKIGWMYIVSFFFFLTSPNNITFPNKNCDKKSQG